MPRQHNSCLEGPPYVTLRGLALIAVKSQSNGRKIAAKSDRQFQLIKQMLRLFVCLNDLHDVAKISCVVNYTVEPLVSDHFPKYHYCWNVS